MPNWLDEAKARCDAARAELARVCKEIWVGNLDKPQIGWRWSIPARPGHDTDLIVGDALSDQKHALALLDRTEALLLLLQHPPARLSPARLAAIDALLADIEAGPKGGSDE